MPPTANRKDPVCFSKHLRKTCNLVERFFNKIKDRRRITKRDGKRAKCYAIAPTRVVVRI